MRVQTLLLAEAAAYGKTHPRPRSKYAHAPKAQHPAASLPTVFGAIIVHAHPNPPRDPEAHQERWLIYCGDVHAGTIIRSIGNPNAVPQWQWRCGFYPGSGPGECTVGTAASFEAARSAFEATWRVFLAKRAEADFQKSRDDWDWTAQKYRRFDRGERMPACGLPQGANVN